MTQIVVPPLGESVRDAIIARWLKAEGETVNRDEPLVELETDKVTLEVNAPNGGTLEKILFPEGSKVSIGDVLAHFQEERTRPFPQPPSSGTSMAAHVLKESATRSHTTSEGSKDSKDSEVKDSEALENSEGLEGPSGTGVQTSPPPTPDAPVTTEVIASPSAMKLATENQVNLEILQGTGKDNRITKEDVLSFVQKQTQKKESTQDSASAFLRPVGDSPKNFQSLSGPEISSLNPQPSQEQTQKWTQESRSNSRVPFSQGSGSVPSALADQRPSPVFPQDSKALEERVPLSPLRLKISERLVESQKTTATLTTFNEVDMTRILEIRNQFKIAFQQKHQTHLGFMSFFLKATVQALKETPSMNAEIQGSDMVYKKYYDIGVAVGTPHGLVVPVIRSVDKKSFADIEKDIATLAVRARERKLSLEDLSGGTFTISNGGVYGSLMSTPILNPPQAGILGMHKVEKRPVVIEDKIHIRPMMYVALSYDHRMVDGAESVTFLGRIKENLENPETLLLDF